MSVATAFFKRPIAPLGQFYEYQPVADIDLDDGTLTEVLSQSLPIGTYVIESNLVIESTDDGTIFKALRFGLTYGAYVYIQDLVISNTNVVDNGFQVNFGTTDLLIIDGTAPDFKIELTMDYDTLTTDSFLSTASTFRVVRLG